MSQEKEKVVPKTAWKKGQPSPNPAGRRKGTGKPISRLRSTLNKLKEREQLAVEIIDEVLEGRHENLTKEQIEMAKWVLSKIESYTRSAIHEESFKMDVREKEQESAQANGTTGAAPKPRLSLTIVSDEEE